MSLRRQATYAAFWGMVQKWGFHGIRLIVFVVLARLLSPTSFGLVALASVFILLGEMFVDQGFSDSLVQRHIIGPAHRDAAFWASCGAGIILTSSCFFGAPWISAAFSEPRLEPVLRWLAPVLLIASWSVTQEALLRRDLAFKRIAAISLTSMGAGGIVGLAMALNGAGVWSLVGQMLTQRLVQLPLLWRATGWRPRLRFSTRHFRALFSFGGNVLVTDLFNFANRQADHLLIGYFIGSTALGYYTVGYRLIRILLDLVPYALLPVAFSAFSRLQREPERLREAFYEASRILLFFAFPTFCGIGLVAPLLIPAIFGERWLPSAVILQALVPIGILQSLGIIYPAALKAVGRTGVVLIITMLNAVTSVIAFAIAVRWGIVAVAISYTLRGYLFWPINWWMMHRFLNLNLPRYLRALVPACVATVVMAVVIVLTKRWLPAGTDVYLTLTACILFGIVSYTVVAMCVAPELFHRIKQLISERTLMRQADN